MIKFLILLVLTILWINQLIYLLMLIIFLSPHNSDSDLTSTHNDNTHTKALSCFTSAFHPLPCSDSRCTPSGPLSLPLAVDHLGLASHTPHSARDYPPLPCCTRTLSPSLLPSPAALSSLSLQATRWWEAKYDRRENHTGYSCPLEFMNY